MDAVAFTLRLYWFHVLATALSMPTNATISKYKNAIKINYCANK